MAPKPTQPKKMQFEKYSPFIPVVLTDRTWPNNVTTKAPLWCSVDLRDGNQALIDPMDVPDGKIDSDSPAIFNIGAAFNALGETTAISFSATITQ